jgi:deoxyribodipyrimidine photolyase
LSALNTRIAGLEARVERATTEFETGALARLHQSFKEVIKQAQERLKHYAEACGESRLVALEAELERHVAPFLNRSQAAINDLERLLETLRQEQTAWETRMAQRHQQDEERLREWLAEETRRFRGLVHDAVIEASGQIKGRIDTIVETACEPLERRVRDAQAHLETLVFRKTDELGSQCEANLERLRTAQEEMDRSFRVQLAAQQAEVLDLFQQQAKDAMMQAIARMHTTLNDALGSAARALHDLPPVSPTQPLGRDSTGNERTTTA